MVVKIRLDKVACPLALCAVFIGSPGCAVPVSRFEPGATVRSSLAPDVRMTVTEMRDDSIVVTNAAGAVATIAITPDLQMRSRLYRKEAILGRIGRVAGGLGFVLAAAGALGGHGNSAWAGRAAGAYENAMPAIILGSVGGAISTLIYTGSGWVPVSSRPRTATQKSQP